MSFLLWEVGHPWSANPSINYARACCVGSWLILLVIGFINFAFGLLGVREWTSTPPLFQLLFWVLIKLVIIWDMVTFMFLCRAPDVFFYPLRPELAESTYMLYRATQNPFYLHVGRDILQSLNAFTRVKCGYATVHNVVDKSLEDRMESFFLSETTKYLFLVSASGFSCFFRHSHHRLFL